jgi:hypothetical protein
MPESRNKLCINKYQYVLMFRNKEKLNILTALLTDLYLYYELIITFPNDLSIYYFQTVKHDSQCL